MKTNVSHTTTYTYDANGNLVTAYDEKIKEKKVCKYSPKGELTFMSILSDEKKVFQLNKYDGAESNIIAGIRYETVTDATGDEGATLSESAYFYSKDIQGSTTAITNKALECVQAYEYTDYENSSVMHIKIRM